MKKLLIQIVIKKVLLVLVGVLVLLPAVIKPAQAATPDDPYIYQYLTPQNISANASDLKTKLDTEVQKVIANGHLVPFRADYGEASISDGTTEIQFYFYHTYDTIYTLSLAYPYVSASTQASIKTYLQSEMATYPAWSTSYLPLNTGTRRQNDSLTQAEFTGLGYPGGYPNRPKLFALYALWLYAQNTGDWNYVNTNWTNIKNFYTNNRAEVSNYYTSIAGAIGYARMAHEKPTPDTAAESGAVTDINNGMTAGLNFQTFGTTAENAYKFSGDWNVYGNCGTRCLTYMGFPFIDISPEIGRYMTDNASLLSSIVGSPSDTTNVNSYSITRGEYFYPQWFMARSPADTEAFGEGWGTPPDVRSMLFPYHVWMKKDSPLVLRSYLDVPDARLGDYFWMQNVTRTIEAYGTTCWTDITTNTSSCGVTQPTNTPGGPTATNTPVPPATATPTPVPTFNMTGGNVYIDTNKDGAQDNGELGFTGGAQVSASATGVTTQNTITNGTGAYAFSNLPATTYTVTLTIPAGYVLSPALTSNSVQVALSQNTTAPQFGIVLAPTNTPVPPTNTPTPAPTGTQTLTFVSSANSDTVDQSGTALDTLYGNGNTGMYYGGSCGSTPCGAGFRFTNVTIPKNATIQSAHLTFFSTTTQWNSLSAVMSADAVGNSATFSSTSLPLSRPSTSATVTQNDDVSWAANTAYNMNDISAVVQEIVNRSDWVSGNAMSIILNGSGNRKFFSSFAAGTTNAPKLVVTFASSGTPVPPTATQTPGGPTNTPTAVPTVTRTPTPVPPTATATPVPTFNMTGGTVFVDTNQDGVQDGSPTESGYSGGATVTASVNGSTVQTTTTNSTGSYSFSNLPATTYTVTLTLPSGYIMSSAFTGNSFQVPLSQNTTAPQFGIVQGVPSLTPTPLALNTEWTQFGHDAAHDNYTAQTVPTTWQYKWQWNGADANGQPQAGHLSVGKLIQPITGNSLIYMATTTGVYAVRQTDGSVAWSNTTLGTLQATPVYANGYLYVASGNNNLYKLDTNNNGTIVATYTATSALNLSPTLVGTTIYIVAGDGTLSAIDTASMTRLWSYTGGSPGATPASYSTSRNMLVYVTRDLFVHGVDVSTHLDKWPKTKPTVRTYECTVDPADPCDVSTSTGAQADNGWPVIAEQHGLVFIRYRLDHNAMWTWSPYPDGNANVRANLVGQPNQQNLFPLNLDTGAIAFIPAVGSSGAGDGSYMQMGSMPVVRVVNGQEVAYIQFRQGQVAVAACGSTDPSCANGNWDATIGEMVLDNTTITGYQAGDMRFIQTQFFPTDESMQITMSGDTYFINHWLVVSSNTISNRSATVGDTIANAIVASANAYTIWREGPQPFAPCTFNAATRYCTPNLYSYGDTRQYGAGFYEYFNSQQGGSTAETVVSNNLVLIKTSDGGLIALQNGNPLVSKGSTLATGNTKTAVLGTQTVNGFIPWQDALKYLNQTATFEGTIESAVNHLPKAIYLGFKNPHDGGLLVRIFNKNVKKFKYDPMTLLGKKIKVTGKVTLYWPENKDPEIIVSDPKQIVIEKQ